jgi:hydroxyacylglutathione hydrolase
MRSKYAERTRGLYVSRRKQSKEKLKQPDGENRAGTGVARARFPLAQCGCRLEVLAMKEALEDDFTDVIRKAQEGIEMDDDHLAAKAGITPAQLRALKEGRADAEALERVAPVLGLSGSALVDLALGRWRPELPIEFAGLARFSSPCRTGSMVNSYLVWDPGTLNGVCFDTGTDALEMLRFATRRSIRIQLVLITHAHSDHIGALQSVIAATDACAFVGKSEGLKNTETFEPGRYFIVGNLFIESKPAPGHSRGSVIYVISGLRRNAAVIGDTLFAGSMGRAFFSYAELLKTNLGKVLSLPENTILCPGHGPMTTVGEEKLHNPFFAKQPAKYADAA